MPGFTLREVLIKRSSSTGWDPAAPALAFEDRELTYGQLSTAVDEIVAGLAEEGFAKGDVVLVLLPNCVEYVELFFAVASVGGVIVPTNYLLSPREVEHIWRDSGATWLVVHETLVEGISTIREAGAPNLRIFGVGETPGITPYESLRRPGGTPPEVAVDIHDVVLLQYTSGTSGLPKAATHTHSTLMWNQIQQVVNFGVTADDVYVCVPALCWAAGFHDYLLPTLWMGGKVVLVPSRGFKPDELAELIERHRATITVLVVSVLRLVVASDIPSRHDVSSLRLVLAGGEALEVELIEQFQAQFPSVWLTQAYGMSEGPMIMTFLGEADAVRKKGSAGKALAATQIRIVDAADEEVAPGTIGEIAVRSAATMIGYAGMEEKTREDFRGGWFHTGDSGYCDEEGYLYVVGRVKDMFISGGLNVYPAEIERVLLLHPRVREVAVIGVPDARFGEVGRAFVMVEDDEPTAELEAELSAHAREHLAGYKIPKQWQLSTESLPRTASGKIKKSELPR